MEKGTGANVIDRVKVEVEGFQSCLAKLEEKVVLGGLSESTLINYGRCLAKIGLHFSRLAIHLDDEQISGFLFELARKDMSSKSYFKHTVYGLRYLLRIYDKA